MGCSSSRAVSPAPLKPTDEAGGHTARNTLSTSAPAAAAAAHRSAKALQAASKSADAVLAHLASANYEPALWPASVEGKELGAALKAIHACMDVLWTPLLDLVEAKLCEAGARPSWDSLTPAGLLALLRGCSGTADMEPWMNADASAALLSMLAATWERRLTLGVSAQPRAPLESAWENRSIGRLLSLLALALCKTVVVEDESALDAKLAAWRTVEQAFGVPREAACAAAGEGGRAILLYADACAVGDAKLRLTCERASALWDTLPQWEQSPMRVRARGTAGTRSQGSAKLFPQFRSAEGGVEHGDGHGPRKELFALMGQQMLYGLRRGAVGVSSESLPAEPEVAPVFPYDRGARHHWFNPTLEPTAERRSMLCYCGWLLAQTICNRSSLGVELPTLLFEALLADDDFSPSIETLRAFDPQAAASLQNVLDMSEAEFADFAELEECVGMSKEKYVSSSVNRIVGGGDGGWQLDELRSGFQSVLPPAVIAPLRFSPKQLAAVVCGAPSGSRGAFSIRGVFRVVEDDELCDCTPLRQALWAVLEGWAPADKLAFIKFCTGSDRLPAPGTEVLSVQMPFTPIGQVETAAMAQMLPQAHTCDNILELPNYYEALVAKGFKDSALTKELKALVQDRFLLAVRSCDSYGLDETGGDGEPFASRDGGPGWKDPPHSLKATRPVQAEPTWGSDEVEPMLELDAIESIDDLLARTCDSPQQTRDNERKRFVRPLEAAFDEEGSAPPPTTNKSNPISAAEWKEEEVRKAGLAAPGLEDVVQTIGSCVEVVGASGDSYVSDDENELDTLLREAEQELDQGIVPIAAPNVLKRHSCGGEDDAEEGLLQALEDELDAMDL